MISFKKNVMVNNLTPHCFIYQTPIKEINILALIAPKSAGIQSFIFFTEGANTPGKLIITQIKPIIHITVSSFDRFI